MVRGIMVIVLCVGVSFLMGCGGNHWYNDTDTQRYLSLKKGLSPTADEVLPGCIIFSYKKTITDLYERDPVDGHRVWLVLDERVAQSVVLDGMRQWKEVHPKATILEVEAVGTAENPTMFLVRYVE